MTASKRSVRVLLDRLSYLAPLLGVTLVGFVALLDSTPTRAETPVHIAISPTAVCALTDAEQSSAGASTHRSSAMFPRECSLE